MACGIRRWGAVLKRICALLLAATALTVAASAAEGNVTYSEEAKECIFAPGSEFSPTDLFPQFKDVMPGDRIEQRILVKNDAKNQVKIKIYIRALGGHPESEEFLSRLSLQVYKDEDEPMFAAAADESAQLSDWVCLGTLYSGGEVELKVVLDVPVTLDNMFKNYAGYLDWEFAIEEYPVEPDDPKPPETGDDAELPRYVILAGLSAGALALLFLLGKKQKQH